MLQYRSVYPETLGLLKKLMQLKALDDFFLVGGTALALQIGHRISVDLDLFTLTDFNANKLTKTLNELFSINEVIEEKNTLHLNIHYPENINTPIKVDFIKYDYPLLKPVVNADGIRLLSLEDIIPMKLSAVSGRGLKKDFYDLYYLLHQYPLNYLLELFQKKFSIKNNLHLIKSLTYFSDADEDADPIIFDDIKWDEIKKFIMNKVNEYLSS